MQCFLSVTRSLKIKIKKVSVSVIKYYKELIHRPMLPSSPAKIHFSHLFFSFLLLFPDQRTSFQACLLIQLGKALYSPGVLDGHTIFLTAKMYRENSDRFCWISPETCREGMTMVFWIYLKQQECCTSKGILTSLHREDIKG